MSVLDREADENLLFSSEMPSSGTTTLSGGGLLN